MVRCTVPNVLHKKAYSDSLSHFSDSPFFLIKKVSVGWYFESLWICHYLITQWFYHPLIISSVSVLIIELVVVKWCHFYLLTEFSYIGESTPFLKFTIPCLYFSHNSNTICLVSSLFLTVDSLWYSWEELVWKAQVQV